jgi:hypothetical protein
MDTPSYYAYEDDRNSLESMPDADDAREETPDTYDQYVGVSVNVPVGDEIRTGKVTVRKREVGGTLARNANSNPMLDTRKYVVDFFDGRSDEYTANLSPRTCMLSAMKRAKKSTSWMGLLATRLTVMR